MRGGIVVAGSLAQKPGRGGHTWVLLQYLLGLRRLGWDVLFLDRLDPEMCVDESGFLAPAESSVNLRYFVDVVERFGLAADCSLLGGDGATLRPTLYGLDRPRMLSRVRDAELLVNCMGFLDDDEILAAARRRVFLDIDPGFTQMWEALGAAELLAGHDDFVTVGRNLGRPGCAVPDCGRQWIATWPPVVLEQWPAAPASDAPFTSVASWRGHYASVSFAGETYGLRVHAFRHFVDLPQRTGQPFEVALDIDPAEHSDLALLATHGWTLVDPRTAAADPRAYRDFVAGSGAEFMVAKDIYVRARSGWFSDRTACYLASGRPAIVQDTGIDGELPTGEGLLTFCTPDEAAAAVAEVARDRRRHGRAARRIAEELFDSDRVLSKLLDRLGVAAP